MLMHLAADAELRAGLPTLVTTLGTHSPESCARQQRSIAPFRGQADGGAGT